MVYRIYVEKKEELAYEAKALLSDIRNFLNITSVDELRILNRYDVEGISEEIFEEASRLILSEPQLDKIYKSINFKEGDVHFVVEYLPGQYDQRADCAAQCIQLASKGNKPEVKTARVYILSGNINEEDIEQIKKYIINPVESRQTDDKEYKSLNIEYDNPKDVDIIENFIDFDDNKLLELLKDYALAMDIDDLRFCRDYFKLEKRNPSITEIRMIDTYWSDHCRHTTFLTNIDKVIFEDEKVEKAWNRYIATREELGRTKPINLMDIATISVKALKKAGKLDKLDESEEINACTVKIKVDVEGEQEDWLLLFKNETHNHPTEIEPFGGAATCIGGAIRDPLSGRAYVYAAMRVTGAADPTKSMEDTIKGKLPQRKIVTTAAAGYSSYGNQIGLATGIVDEIYHDGYAAKRMEIGAVVAATPAANVRREVPVKGDKVILLGGRTGRDGCGGATGSSKAHKEESLKTCGAEVQKGNAPEERKLQRLFRNEEAKSLIKRCNDFGAGGVSVAIGELADGLRINLDAVPKKYEGLDGTELAISESQERMAVVVEAKDVNRFIELASEENLEATLVAEVTDENRLIMTWRDKEIVNLSRDFLNSNGASKHINIKVPKMEEIEGKNVKNFKLGMEKLVNDLNVCSKQGLSERFDSTIGVGTVLMPFGGKYQKTPIAAMVNKVSVEKKDTTTCSIMSYAYNPFISEKDQYKGAYLAVVESLCKLIATGADYKDIYLTFQEYFEKLGTDEKRWAKPLAAILGALDAQLDFEVAAIGGKDSMSGSFENLDVPPTLVSFAVTTEDINNIISPEFKKAGSKVMLLSAKRSADKDLPDVYSLKALFNFISSKNKDILAMYTVGYGGVAEQIFKQCLGNRLGFDFDSNLSVEDIFEYNYGSFIVELDKDFANDDLKLLEDNEIDLKILGYVSEEYKLKYKEDGLQLAKLENSYEEKLEKVFPRKIEAESYKEVPNIGVTTKEKYSANIKSTKPKVLIPVFPGTNCEYDSAKAIAKAGLEPEIVLIKNLSSKTIEESINEIEKNIRNSQIVFLPGGFSGGDEPDGSAKFISSFFRNPRVKDAISDLLDNRDGLMAGICNGFQALIKLGLVPYGKIVDIDETCPTLSYNTIKRHQSMIVRTKISSNNSPWLMNVNVGEVYNVAISHGEGRFICDENLLKELAANGQIATQYVDLGGKPTMDIVYNPNGSMWAVEGICSPDGRVFGKMGHSERIGKGLYKNVVGNYDIGMFRSAKKYFDL
jgi:phosphoribosylformylglycinamidine synthase